MYFTVRNTMKVACRSADDVDRAQHLFFLPSHERTWNLHLGMAVENSRCTLLMNHPVSVCVCVCVQITTFKISRTNLVFIKNLTNRNWLRVLPAVSPSLGRRPPTQTSIFSNRLLLSPRCGLSLFPPHIPPLAPPRLSPQSRCFTEPSMGLWWHFSQIKRESTPVFFLLFLGLEPPHP